MRVDQAPAYVLHTRAYRNTSALVEIFSADYGRVSVVAKGAFRPNSPLAAIRQLFCGFELSWVGRNALKTLTALQPLGQMRWFQGKALISGLYLNELLVKLLDAEDPQPEIFAHYERALVQLSHQVPAEVCLRLFEKVLVCEVGFGLDLMQAVDATGTRVMQVEPERRYCFDPQVGLRVVEQALNHPAFRVQGEECSVPQRSEVSGRTLIALASERLDCVQVLSEAKRFLAALIAHSLGDKTLNSPKVWRVGVR